MVENIQKFLVIPKTPLQMRLKLSQKKAEVTGGTSGNKIVDRIMSVSETSPQNSLRQLKINLIKENRKKEYISWKMADNCWWSEINIIA